MHVYSIEWLHRCTHRLQPIILSRVLALHFFSRPRRTVHQQLDAEVGPRRRVRVRIHGEGLLFRQSKSSCEMTSQNPLLVCVLLPTRTCRFGPCPSLALVVCLPTPCLDAHVAKPVVWQWQRENSQGSACQELHQCHVGGHVGNQNDIIFQHNKKSEKQQQ